MDYLLHIAVIAAIFASLALSLDLAVGQSGILSLSHAGFYGLGAYAAAMLTVFCHAPWGLGLLCAVAVPALFSLLVSVPSRRLRGDYLVIASFGFQVIVFGILNNWVEVTRGPMGIAGIPSPRIGSVTLNSPGAYLPLPLVVLAAALWLVTRVSGSPFGRILHAIREDESLGQALAKNTWRAKVLAMAVSAGMAGLAGSLYAYYASFVDPTSFTITESVLILSMVIIGGAGSPWGPLIGAVILVALPEGLRFIGLPSGAAANVRQILYGSLLVLMMLVRPRGLLGRYDFGR